MPVHVVLSASARRRVIQSHGAPLALVALAKTMN